MRKKQNFMQVDLLKIISEQNEIIKTLLNQSKAQTTLFTRMSELCWRLKEFMFDSSFDSLYMNSIDTDFDKINNEFKATIKTDIQKSNLLNALKLSVGGAL